MREKYVVGNTAVDDTGAGASVADMATEGAAASKTRRGRGNGRPFTFAFAGLVAVVAVVADAVVLAKTRRDV